MMNKVHLLVSRMKKKLSKHTHTHTHTHTFNDGVCQMNTEELTEAKAGTV